jgi:hypothetical protein
LKAFATDIAYSQAGSRPSAGPLADTFLLHYGAYPDATEIGIDYSDLLLQATLAIDCRIDTSPVAREEHPIKLICAE